MRACEPEPDEESIRYDAYRERRMIRQWDRARRSPIDPRHSFYLNGGELLGNNGVTVDATYVHQSIGVNNFDTSPVVNNSVPSSIVNDVIHMSSAPDADVVLMETFLESYSECLLTTPEYTWIPEPIDHVLSSPVDPRSTQTMDGAVVLNVSATNIFISKYKWEEPVATLFLQSSSKALARPTHCLDTGLKPSVEIHSIQGMENSLPVQVRVSVISRSTYLSGFFTSFLMMIFASTCSVISLLASVQSRCYLYFVHIGTTPRFHFKSPIPLTTSGTSSCTSCPPGDVILHRAAKDTVAPLMMRKRTRKK